MRHPYFPILLAAEDVAPFLWIF